MTCDVATTSRCARTRLYACLAVCLVQQYPASELHHTCTTKQLGSRCSWVLLGRSILLVTICILAPCSRTSIERCHLLTQ